MKNVSFCFFEKYLLSRLLIRSDKDRRLGRVPSGDGGSGRGLRTICAFESRVHHSYAVLLWVFALITIYQTSAGLNPTKHGRRTCYPSGFILNKKKKEKKKNKNKKGTTPAHGRDFEKSSEEIAGHSINDGEKSSTALCFPPTNETYRNTCCLV